MILHGVREYCENYPVELVRNEQTNGRPGIRALNEGGNNEVLIDLFDLLEWLQRELPGTIEAASPTDPAGDRRGDVR